MERNHETGKSCRRHNVTLDKSDRGSHLEVLYLRASRKTKVTTRVACIIHESFTHHLPKWFRNFTCGLITPSVSSPSWARRNLTLTVTFSPDRQEPQTRGRKVEVEGRQGGEGRSREWRRRSDRNGSCRHRRNSSYRLRKWEVD